MIMFYDEIFSISTSWEALYHDYNGTAMVYIYTYIIYIN